MRYVFDISFANNLKTMIALMTIKNDLNFKLCFYSSLLYISVLTKRFFFLNEINKLCKIGYRFNS